ncbi:MAG TPA: MerR family transcriptional regulator [Actinomycetota bacterium]|nr:MerR family transcriptional regulator [Actinomycetota bacterium]
MSLYRIGTASRRSGLPIATLRNWELRYGLVTPIRTPGGQRLYSDDNIERLRALKVLVDQGLSAGEAHNVLRGRLRAPARPRAPAPRAARAGDARPASEPARRGRVVLSPAWRMTRTWRTASASWSAASLA